MKDIKYGLGIIDYQDSLIFYSVDEEGFFFNVHADLFDTRGSIAFRLNDGQLQFWDEPSEEQKEIIKNYFNKRNIKFNKKYKLLISEFPTDLIEF